MGRIVSAFGIGALFGIGLALSRMIDPAKVLGFLDVAGDWDPTLAFVMLGALLVAVPAFRVTGRRHGPVLADRFYLPARRALDAKLFGGAAIFGIGWGLVGFCPGPALASLGLGLWRSGVFALAMLAGMVLHRFFLADGSGALTPSSAAGREGDP